MLHLTDLTIQAAPRPAVRRELLRWRDLVLVAALYLGIGDETPLSALRVLLRFTPTASRQLEALGLLG